MQRWRSDDTSESISQTLTSSWLSAIDKEDRGQFPELFLLASWARRIRGYCFLDPLKLRAPSRGEGHELGVNGESLAPLLARLRDRDRAASIWASSGTTSASGIWSREVQGPARRRGALRHRRPGEGARGPGGPRGFLQPHLRTMADGATELDFDGRKLTHLPRKPMGKPRAGKLQAACPDSFPPFAADIDRALGASAQPKPARPRRRTR